MSKKTERKNKINQELNWPAKPFFTMEELWATNPDFKEITLRVRLNKEIEKSIAAELGSLSGEQGRPKKVWTLLPLTDATMAAAKQRKVTVIEESRLQKLRTTVHATPFATAPVPKLVS